MAEPDSAVTTTRYTAIGVVVDHDGAPSSSSTFSVRSVYANQAPTVSQMAARLAPIERCDALGGTLAMG